MFQTKAKVIKNIAVRRKYYKIILSCPRIVKTAKPGQFLQIRTSESGKPFLRRPFSIYRASGRNTEILYEVLGTGTIALSQRKAGEYLDVIGPLGNGFNYRASPTSILVAGGMGVAPLFFLAEKLTQHKPLILIGARTKKQILCEKELLELGYSVKIATDDGSCGFKGKATDLLKNILRSTKYKAGTTIYACGPKPMLKEIAIVSKHYHLAAQISLEEHMACGIGTCLGCVVNTKDGYERVCKEGPVFNADEIVWAFREVNKNG